MATSLKTLRDAFPREDEETLQAIRFALQRAEKAPRLFPSSYSRRIEETLAECNVLLNAHGVECITARVGGWDPLVEYVNMGDTYVCTIMFDHVSGTFKVTSWGDWLETYERRHGRVE